MKDQPPKNTAGAAKKAHSSAKNAAEKAKKPRPKPAPTVEPSTADATAAADAADKKDNKRKKKKKPKSKGGSENQKEKKKKQEKPDDGAEADAADAAPAKERRDFATDLKNYLSQWVHKDTYGGWRFNKNLQVWALEHVFDDTKIDGELFKALLPYLASIQGAAKDRLLERADKVIEEAADDDDGTGGTDMVSDASLKRALKIRTKVGSKTS